MYSKVVAAWNDIIVVITSAAKNTLSWTTFYIYLNWLVSFNGCNRDYGTIIGNLSSYCLTSLYQGQIFDGCRNWFHG